MQNVQDKSSHLHTCTNIHAWQISTQMKHSATAAHVQHSERVNLIIPKSTTRRLDLLHRVHLASVNNQNKCITQSMQEQPTFP